jgi:SAM-dependent methyltransferase
MSMFSYEEFPYPNRRPVDEAWRLLTPPQDYLVKANFYGWGARKDLSQLRVLVAGGGTGDAAVFLAEQLRTLGNDQPDAVTYLDLSRASRIIAEDRIAQRGLKNIRFVSGKIEEIAELAPGPYDYINCTGVLHHLPDPDAGLAALRLVSADDVVMAIMVYGRYGRRPTAHMRALLNRLIPSDRLPRERLAVAKSVLAELPDSNPFKKGDHDGFFDALLRDDSELYDLLLNPIERTYDVPQFYQLIEGAGLKLLSFSGFFLAGGTNKSFYRVDSYIKNIELSRMVDSMPLPAQHALAEMLHGDIPLHSAYIGGPTTQAALPSQLDRVPFFFVPSVLDLSALIDARAGQPIEISDSHGNAITLTGQPGLGDLIRQIDGKRTVRDVILAAAQTPLFSGVPDPTGLASETFSNVFTVFNGFDWMLLDDGTEHHYRLDRSRVLNGRPKDRVGYGSACPRL